MTSSRTDEVMMSRLPLALFLFVLVVSTSVESSAAEAAPGTPNASSSNFLLNTWHQASSPWGALKQTASPFPDPIANQNWSVLPDYSTKLSTPPPPACDYSIQTPSAFAKVHTNLAAVRDALYGYIDTAYHFLMPLQGIHGSQWAPDCRKFVAEDGAYGPYGKVMSDSISPETHPNLFNAETARDISLICPAFKSWKGDDEVRQKKAFWVWFAAAMAQAESSCNQDIREKRGPGGILKGMFQLAKNQEDTFPIHAPAADHCSRGSSLTATGSGICFFKMLNFYVGVHRNVFYSSRETDRYFQPLQNGADSDKVRGLVGLYKPCKL